MAIKISKIVFSTNMRFSSFMHERVYAPSNIFIWLNFNTQIRSLFAIVSHFRLLLLLIFIETIFPLFAFIIFVFRKQKIVDNNSNRNAVFAHRCRLPKLLRITCQEVCVKLKHFFSPNEINTFVCIFVRQRENVFFVCCCLKHACALSYYTTRKSARLKKHIVYRWRFTFITRKYFYYYDV